jgi:hypothetical protein
MPLTGERGLLLLAGEADLLLDADTILGGEIREIVAPQRVSSR